MWKSPIYKFRIPKKQNEESDELVELVFDVTGSAPSFKEPSDELIAILDEIFKSKDFSSIESVIEFGAAKLKNIPFILKHGKTVCAVEFEELSKNPITIKNIKKCEKFGDKFQNLLFPNPFITDTKKFDLALLLNVPPVMPVPVERLYLLDLIYEKVKNGKYLLWVAQKEGSYKADRESGKFFCGDGIWQGKNRYNKTFYKYFNHEDLDEMMSLYGFKLIQKWNLGSDARFYEKTDYNLFNNIITQKRILNTIKYENNIPDPKDTKPMIVEKSDEIKLIIPNPREFSIESLYIEKIKSIPEGKDNAELYHRIVSHAIARVFRGSLRNMDLKTEIKDGVKIIDTIFTNCAKDGFFHNLKEEVKCNFPIVEVKNYTDDTKNPEIDQLNGRFNKNHGHFGILVCRNIKNEDAMYTRCSTVLPEHVILFLTDKDIFELLELSREQNSAEISDFMDKKLRTLLFKKG
ncbi:hypothetical protein J4230_02580 [Candidatus Woesearchaeota archaeon]|nr:hypothetical protein [Candidatus Woesearchaeota archaeon]